VIEPAAANPPANSNLFGAVFDQIHESHRIILAPIKVDRLVLKTMPVRRQAQESS